MIWHESKDYIPACGKPIYLQRDDGRVYMTKITFSKKEWIKTFVDVKDALKRSYPLWRYVDETLQPISITKEEKK